MAFTSKGVRSDGQNDTFGVLLSQKFDNDQDRFSAGVKYLHLESVTFMTGIEANEHELLVKCYWNDANVMRYWHGHTQEHNKQREVSKLYIVLHCCLMIMLALPIAGFDIGHDLERMRREPVVSFQSGGFGQRL